MTGVFALFTLSYLLKLGNDYILRRYWPEQMGQTQRKSAPQPIAQPPRLLSTLRPLDPTTEPIL
jgi:hypothetical protein